MRRNTESSSLFPAFDPSTAVLTTRRQTSQPSRKACDGMSINGVPIQTLLSA